MNARWTTRAGVYLSAIAVVVLALGLTYRPQTAVAAGDSNENCIRGVFSGTFGGLGGLAASATCNAAHDGGADGPKTMSVDCGHVASVAGGVTKWDNPACGAPRGCTLTLPDGTVSAIETFATLQQDPKTKAWTLLSTWCPSAANPIPDAQALREQAVRLLPKVAVGWINPHLSLVNVEEIFWIPTTTQRDLGPVTVVGQAVRLRVQFDNVAWDFGDASTDTSTTLGKPYDQSNPCATKQCPGYFGHTYLTRGPRTVSMTVSWTGQYSLDGGTTWTTIAGGPITGTPSTATFTVKEAYTILIDPSR
jgi:hypothetical protein